MNEILITVQTSMNETSSLTKYPCHSLYREGLQGFSIHNLKYLNIKYTNFHQTHHKAEPLTTTE
jgi:hypothetical protein